MPVALITGVNGQDGSYLAELLLSKGYTIHGTIRPSSTPNTWRIDHIKSRLHLHQADVTADLTPLVYDVQPDEVYHLAAQAHVGSSFDIPVHVGDATGLGAVRVFEAVRRVAPKARVYQASTSELFGNHPPPQSELTPMKPVSPYGAAKLYAYIMAGLYRDAYGMFVSNGILFNHESPRRSERFLSRKVAVAVAEIARGERNELRVGNLAAQRDWGYAPEYVKAIWDIMQFERPDDFVIGTGEMHTPRELIDIAFAHAGLDPNKYVRFDEDFVRPLDTQALRADCTKAQRILGWRPKTNFADIVRLMVDAELHAKSPSQLAGVS